MTEREHILAKRRRGLALKWIRQGHEEQLNRMDDLELWAMYQDLGFTMGRDQVLTLLQDLRVLGYITFAQKSNERSGRIEISCIELTAAGLGLVVRQRSNDEVLFD